MRRIALYSDIHGNDVALGAVYADMDAEGVPERYCLGDLVGYGPAPSAVISAVRASGDAVIQGNYDRGVGGRLGDCGCYYGSEQAAADGAASYAFTDAALDDPDAAYLASLPETLRLEHDGARLLLCHGSPRRVNEYLLPDRTDAQLARLAAEGDADVVCCGHVHVPYHRVVPGDVHYVNAGSVGKPKDGDPRACWVELVLGDREGVLAGVAPDALVREIASTGVWASATVHRVAYDIEAVVRAMHAAGLPATLASALSGS